jgi:hypothetical protein
MTDSPDIPEMLDTKLAWPVVDELFTKLAERAELEGVLVKEGPEAYSRGAGRDLAAALAALRAGAAGVQLRYRLEGKAWCDTLLPAGAEVRLVRIECTTP